MKSKQIQSAQAPGQSGIRVLTVALFIILLAFFVVLHSIAVVDEKRKLEAIGSLIGTFGLLPSGLSPVSGVGHSISPAQAPILGEDDSTMVPHELSVDASEMEWRGLVGLGLPDARPVTIRATSKGRVISIEDQVVFDKDSYRIKPSSYAFLTELCQFINQDSYPVEIAGHTDNIPADEKPFGSNWEISALRALEVLKFFAVIGKVDSSRLIAYGCNQYKPIASNETRQTRARNRRVDIILDQRSRQRLQQFYRKEPSAFFIFKRFVFSIFD
jgi:chemotaxis protein MotB